MEAGMVELSMQVGHLLAAEVPTVDGAYVLQIASRVLHIVSAMILVGGLFFMRTILSPAGADACYAGRRAVWAKWAGIATALLLATGFYNFFLINGQAKVDGGKLPAAYHMLFGAKFLLALLVMFLVAILAGKTSAADRFRGQMRKWLNIAWLAAIMIVVIAAVLRTFH